MKRNLHTGIPSELPDELVEIIAGNGAVRIERIVSRGHHSPEGFWYDQHQTEFVLVVAGEAQLAFEDRQDPLQMKAGDCITIPAHARHRVAWTAPTEDTVWLAVYY